MGCHTSQRHPVGTHRGRNLSTEAADARAAEAEHTVTSLFGHRLLGLPGTHLARVAFPAPPRGGPWHYWWQAHYLDATIDAALRHLRHGDTREARQRAHRSDRILATIGWRNGIRFTNDYYDDMAWLVLAVGRLRDLHQSLDRSGPTAASATTASAHRMRAAEQALTTELRSAVTDDSGGGVFWNTTRDFKNVPATAPSARHLARTGDSRTARRLVEWIYDRLVNDDGLLIDGLRLAGGAEHPVPDVYTYNQGSVLGSLLALGDEIDLARARDLVAAVDRRLTTRRGDRHVLHTHGGGDGGLFTGILVRYLAVAATHPTVDGQARATSRRLVLDTADALWEGRELRDSGHRGAVTVFSPDPMVPAHDGLPGGGRLELSSQLQAWTILEAAARASA